MCARDWVDAKRGGRTRRVPKDAMVYASEGVAASMMFQLVIFGRLLLADEPEAMADWEDDFERKCWATG